MRKKTLFVSLLILIMIISGCGSKAKSESYENEQAATGEIGKDVNEKSNDNITDDIVTDSKPKEYEYGQLAMGGGGFVTGLIAHPNSEGVIYSRTDVGGAYRYNAVDKKWECMSYGISERDKGLLSVDGFAIDPSDDKNIYMVAGCEYFSGGKTAVLISNDKGETFKQADVTNLIRVHGNGMGRQNGERIAVDPLNSQTILCGGRTGGLIVSCDSGETWNRVESFPIMETENKTGIVSIVFDGQGKVYVGVSQTGEKNIYVSDDGLNTWKTIDVLPTDLMPQRMKFDTNGNLLITYADKSGPWDCSTGAIYRYNPLDNTAMDISPSNRPFGDVVFDKNNPDRLVASTINTWMRQTNGAYGDQYFTSEDGGATWREISSFATIDTNNCPWIDGYAIHWSGSLLLDPFNSNSLMVVSGNGIFACDNIWDDVPAFYFNAHGLEETVPLDIMSIPDGPLVTAIGDYDGCVYYDTYEYGQRHTVAIGTTTCVAFGGEDKNVWIKIGSNNEKSSFYISTDSGASWKAAEGIKIGDIYAAGGKGSVSADGKTIFFSPENAKATYYSEDLGKTWNECAGLSGNLQITCDTVNSNYVYASGNGFFVSSDGGKSFIMTDFFEDKYKRFCQPYGIEGKILTPLGDTYAVSTDYGMSFTRNENLTECYSIGVGKAAEEGKPYVIYIYGVAGNGLGVYSSEDDGKTWERINDDAHQFGGTGNGNFIIGDMNEYGKYYFGTVGLGVAYGKLKN